MNKIFRILAQEYKSTVATKAFIFGAIIFPAVFYTLVIVVPTMVESEAPQMRGTVAIYDPTGFAYDHKNCNANNYDYFTHFQREAQACRRPGVASLDLACVAAGRFDGFWEMKLKPWDLAAGILLVEEAGGKVSDFDGRPMSLDFLECLASNGLIHTEMQTVLQQGCRPHVVG